MKIRAKHMVTILVPAVFILSIGIMMFWNFDLNTRQAREKAEDLAGKKANEIQTYLDMAMAASRNTAVVYEGLIKANLLTRDIANSILKQLLEDNLVRLGDGLDLIDAQKGGSLERGIPIVVGSQRPPVHHHDAAVLDEGPDDRQHLGDQSL